MKIIILIAFGFPLILVHCTMNTNQNYNCKKNYEVNKTIGLQYFIESSTKNGFFFCLSACNLNPNCLTIVYQKNSMNMNTGTCILYSKIFQESEIIISMGSDLYSKTGISSQTISVATSTQSPTMSFTETTTQSSTISSTESTTQSPTISSTESTAQSSTILTSSSVGYYITELNIRLINGKFSVFSE